MCARRPVSPGTRPLSEVKPKARQLFLEGDAKRLGLLTLLEQEYATAIDPALRVRLETFRGLLLCPACHGARLKPTARACRFHGKAIHELAALTVREAHRFFQALTLDADEEPIATPIVSEIVKRLDFMERVGVDYLTLDRPADTLSGGELQRVRLATGIGSGLVGVCYVLDEPSIGLHPRDNQRLIDALRGLQTQGNTVLVVEHDEAMMRQADHLIDIGPGCRPARRSDRCRGNAGPGRGKSRFNHRKLPGGTLAAGRPPRSDAAPARPTPSRSKGSRRTI